jgi:hypothetical protein
MMWTGDCFKPETEATSDSAFVSGKHHVIPAGAPSRQHSIVPVELGDGQPRCLGPLTKAVNPHRLSTINQATTDVRVSSVGKHWIRAYVLVQ